ncbi:hypothetical protein [Collimonas sp.]|jgi:hypothetical protein|uniref:hypothetical protein n=1 Tax=Collimonas sp. TaxID=1963772 RepID=UPI002CE45B38|nr:hypothetical protein [Collimonas sp.]HWX01424.1 hypothetical protein [Collimonas sp.]
MKSMRVLIFIFICSLTHIGFAEDGQKSNLKDSLIKDEYPSQFGMIQLTNDGSVVLNGKILLKGNSEKDDFGTTIDYSAVDFQVNKNSPAIETKRYGDRKYFSKQVYRLVLVGRSQNPVFYRIMDLTGKEPYISDKFGKNDHWANNYKSTKWGKKQSLIKLDGGYEYTYTAGKGVEEN